MCNFLRCSLLRTWLCSCLPSPCLPAGSHVLLRGLRAHGIPFHLSLPATLPMVCTVNTHHIMDAAVPFGGYKESGFGREHGSAILEHYTQAGGGPTWLSFGAAGSPATASMVPTAAMGSRGAMKRVLPRRPRLHIAARLPLTARAFLPTPPHPLQTKSVIVPLPKSKEQRSWVIM